MELLTITHTDTLTKMLFPVYANLGSAGMEVLVVKEGILLPQYIIIFIEIGDFYLHYHSYFGSSCL